jgi:hypothetical protein
VIPVVWDRGLAGPSWQAIGWGSACLVRRGWPWPCIELVSSGVCPALAVFVYLFLVGRSGVVVFCGAWLLRGGIVGWSAAVWLPGGCVALGAW